MKGNYRVAIIHYHLRGGGVTRVIETAVRVLRKSGIKVCVLSGEAPAGRTGIPDGVVGIIPALAYSSGVKTEKPENLLRQVEAGARNILGGDPRIWHIHNHHLGKNFALPLLAGRLARKPVHLLLQIHDFPEDGRPENYRFLTDELRDDFPAVMYPFAAHVHYATLNQRDYSFLAEAGMPERNLHYLPNAVIGFNGVSGGEHPPDWPTGPLVLYPTRAIRRKNIGELLFWAALADDDRWFATTLIPENPSFKRVYLNWVGLAQELKLPVKFGLGERGYTYEFLMTTATAAITTSVSEGFGLAYLEPWLLDRPVAGRDLREVTADYRQAGIDLSHLYRHLEVPIKWVGRDSLIGKMEKNLVSSLRAYGRVSEPGDLERAVADTIIDDRVDFGKLDEELQEKVLRIILNSPSSIRELDIPDLLPSEKAVGKLVAGNKDRVNAEYGEDQYGERLKDCYDFLLKADPGPVENLDPEKLLDRFLKPERFCLLKTG